MRYVVSLILLFSIVSLAAPQAIAGSLYVENASFEFPEVDANAFPALPYVDGWTEIDLDTQGSANTGVFPNTSPDSSDHVINADGRQLAFLGSQAGNGLEQDLSAVYNAGCSYQMTVGIGISGRFPPFGGEPADTLELALYYRDVNDPNVTIDIVTETVDANGLSPTVLQDFSVYLPMVYFDEICAGMPIGIAIRATGMAGGFWDLDNVRLIESFPVSIHVENASFEFPEVDANAFPALPYVDGWTEIDLDIQGSTNTGVFPNTSADSSDHVINADGRQLAFLGSQAGNGLEQDLLAIYNAGCSYHMTVGIGISGRFPPFGGESADTLELTLYYRDVNDPNVTIDIVTETVDANGLSPTELLDFSVYLPMVYSNEIWAGRTIGIAIRATGMAGGFWDLDNVRLIESFPVSIYVENASFEYPVIDPLNAYGAVPIVDGWIELDVDPEGLSRNTGVFANTEPDSFDHIINADGNQLAFLFSEEGNALAQNLNNRYQSGCSYNLTVAIGVSSRVPPTELEPVGTLELAFYYHDIDDPNQTIDIVTQTIEATGLVPTILQDFSLNLPMIYPDDIWANEEIGIAIRATGVAGGVWVFDNVRLDETLLIHDFALMVKE